MHSDSPSAAAGEESVKLTTEVGELHLLHISQHRMFTCKHHQHCMMHLLLGRPLRSHPHINITSKQAASSSYPDHTCDNMS